MLVVSVAACGTSEPVSVDYNERENTTLYSSQTINTGHTLASSNYGSSRTLELRASADCSGADCTPETVRLAFLVTSGSNPVQFPDRSLVVETDEETHEVSQAYRRDAEKTSRVGRHLLTVEMDFEKFEDIATSENVDMKVGTRSFSLSHDRRATFRAMVDATGGTQEITD